MARDHPRHPRQPPATLLTKYVTILLQCFLGLSQKWNRSWNPDLTLKHDRACVLEKPSVSRGCVENRAQKPVTLLHRRTRMAAWSGAGPSAARKFGERNKGDLDESALADLLEVLSAKRQRRFLLLVEQECVNFVGRHKVDRPSDPSHFPGPDTASTLLEVTQ